MIVLQESGCLALERLTADTSLVRIHHDLVQEGAQEALMSAIRQWPRRVQLLKNGTGALRHLVTSRVLSTEFVDLHALLSNALAEGEKLLTEALEEERKTAEAAERRRLSVAVVP